MKRKINEAETIQTINEDQCKVKLPYKLAVYPLICCFASLVTQLKRQKEGKVIEKVEITEDRWVMFHLVERESLQVQIEVNASEDGLVEFLVPEGTTVSSAIQILLETNQKLFWIRTKLQFEDAESIGVNGSKISIQAKRMELTPKTNTSSIPKESFLILDGSNLLNRSWYATTYKGTENLMKTSEGIYTNAVFTFVEMLFRLVRKYQPKYLLVAWDVSRDSTFRKARYPSYKSNRDETDPILREQFGTVQELLTAMNIPQMKVDGYEADDVIGTLSRRWSKEKNGLCYMVSNDRDLLQLLDENVVQIIKDKSGEKVYTLQNFKQDFGISPLQWPDVKALLGDKGDNLPGCPGVGETAGHLSNTLEHWRMFLKTWNPLLTPGINGI
jgi:hypothetical protein